MKWLTRRWHGWEGEPLTSEEEAELETAYLAHVVAVLPRLPERLKLFAGQPDEQGHVSLHDGRVEWWSLDGLRTLTLQVFCGDDRIGYRRLVIQYRGEVQLVGADVTWLTRWLDDPRTELLYDEVDVVSPGRFEHRHLLWPEGEFGVRFAEVSVVSAPASPDIYRVLMRRKRLESSAAFARTMGLYESARRGARDLRLRLDDLR